MAEALATEPVPLAMDVDGVLRVRGTRIPLETVLAAFNEGATPEEIAQQYPSMSLADAYQVIGYYLRRSSELAEYLDRRGQEATEVRAVNERRWAPSGIRERLAARRSA